MKTTQASGFWLQSLFNSEPVCPFESYLKAPYLTSQLQLRPSVLYTYTHPPKMNNSIPNVTSTTSSAITSELIQEAYSDYAYMLVSVSVFTLLVYTTVLDISREVMYMWLSPKPFSIPTLLYALMRYGMLISQGIAFWLSLVPGPGSLCNNLANAENAVFLLARTGTQGILVIRAYTLCQGNKVIAGALVFFFMGGTITNLYDKIMSNGCILTNFSPGSLMVISASNILLIATESLVFCVCLWKVWGTWKLKGETGIRSNNDLVSVMLRQILSQFCFVIVFTNALAIFDLIGLNSIAISILGDLQHSFSAILLANFTLDLRQQNFSAIQSANVALPTIQFRSVVDYIHQSIIVEMGDHENINITREGGDDDILGSPDVEIRREELAY